MKRLPLCICVTGGKIPNKHTVPILVLALYIRDYSFVEHLLGKNANPLEEFTFLDDRRLL